MEKTHQFVRIDLPCNVIPNLRPVVEAYQPYKKENYNGEIHSRLGYQGYPTQIKHICKNTVHYVSFFFIIYIIWIFCPTYDHFKVYRLLYRYIFWKKHIM